MRQSRWIWMALGAAFAAAAATAANDAFGSDARTIADCQAIDDRTARLDCYDAVSGRDLSPHGKHLEGPPTATGTTPAAVADRIAPAGGILGESWGFDASAEKSKFEIRQYHRNYLVAYGTSPFNVAPQTSPERVYADQPSTDPKGVEFQISGKVRVFDRDDHAYGLWLAYTQQSWWQAFAASDSRPFRESNYQPEVIVALRPEVFGVDNDSNAFAWRLLNFGVAHQSNGQSGAASRSWNRVYAEAGFEHDWKEGGQLALLARGWYRIGEDPGDDDNPGITDYLGHGDLRAVYRRCNYLLTAMVRGNLRTGKGAGELAFAFPLVPPSEARTFPVKGYFQIFTGYGESLLDYNWRQTSIGIGFMLNDRR
jgi:phospholipase A1